ncbi:MAG: hypothetical protein IKQ03_04185 [Prevotella sp.]|nr:hypothetical protein [Prevotella sp.]
MKKVYQKPQAEVVKVRCKDQLLWGDEANNSQPWNTGDAKEMQIRFEEEEEMHEELGKIFSEDNLVDPWK